MVLVNNRSPLRKHTGRCIHEYIIHTAQILSYERAASISVYMYAVIGRDFLCCRLFSILRFELMLLLAKIRNLLYKKNL